ncbi:MAG: YraN family protein [Candidatus Levybacteria bacterium]|nr:YraN family protein [Candidatus Levybacteria bacterium]
MNNNIPLGKLGEDLASKFLEKKGYKIIDRNFKKRYGEIDIIAIDSSEKTPVLVFIEVKTRTSSEYGSPLEAITYWKLKSLIKAAQYYKLTHRNLPDGLRIDAVSIKLGYNGETESIEHVKNISG